MKIVRSNNPATLSNSKGAVTVTQDFSLSLSLHFSEMEKQRFWLVLRVSVFSILKGVFQ